MTMKWNMTVSRPLPTLFAALACGLALSSPLALAVAQDADAAEKPKATSKADKDQSDSKSKKADAGKDVARESADAEPEHVYKTPEEWRKLLTPEQFMVTRMKATEPAFSGKFASGHPKGMFECVCCGAKLFDSRTKFESGTGWPSFWQPVSAKALHQSLDQSEYEPRIEVTCARCGAHLGHVFDDGPPPTGLRFCVNSLSLKLDSEPTKATTNKTPARGVRRRTTPSSSRNSASKSSKPTTGEKPDSKGSGS